MVFTSPVFLFFFFPAVFILNRLIRGNRQRNILILAASLVFYAFGQLGYVLLLLASILINFCAGLLLREKLAGNRLVVTLAIIFNLLVLAVFKYTDFLISNINSIADTYIELTGITLPVGISFFTFRGMSYVIDVYRKPDAGTRDFVKAALYISLFTSITAGPITEYRDMSAQLDSRSITPDKTFDGVIRFSLGFAKKLLISNTAGTAADKIFAMTGSGTVDFRLAWLGAVCYMLQIYYDFSGYSDMAIGISGMFGFDLAENFNFPYAASSIREFWRRWHISLSTWFRDYLYIPLGGNRKGKRRAALNRMAVFVCTGIWHGANWTFVIWGILHGLLSNLEDRGLIPVNRLEKSKTGKVIGRIYTLLAVMLLFVLFRADSLRQAWIMIKSMFAFRTYSDADYIIKTTLTGALWAALGAGVLLCGGIGERVKAKNSVISKESGVPAYACALAALILFAVSLTCMAKGGFSPFIYFQF